MVLLLGAIVGCHCSVLWLGGKVTTNFGGVDVVPLLGAIVVCYGWGRVTANFGGVDEVPLQGAIVVCYGWEKVTANFGGVDVVPLLGAIAGCHCSVPYEFPYPTEHVARSMLIMHIFCISKMHIFCILEKMHMHKDFCCI